MRRLEGAAGVAMSNNELVGLPLVTEAIAARRAKFARYRQILRDLRDSNVPVGLLTLVSEMVDDLEFLEITEPR